MIVYPYSKIYGQFLGIHSGEYQKLIAFYEENEDQIRHLPLDQFREIFGTYADAVFENGSYKKYILIADEILPWAFDCESDKELFYKILFRKAASLYNLGHLQKAENILEQLYRINSNNVEAKMFLKKCFKIRNSVKVQKVRALSLLLLFLSAMVIMIELLWITPFFERSVIPTRIIRTSLFSGAFFIMVGNLIFQEIKAHLYLYSKRKPL